MRYVFTVLTTLVAVASWSVYGQETAAADRDKFDHLTCYYIEGGKDPHKDVKVTDQFIENQKVRVGKAALLCDPAKKKDGRNSFDAAARREGSDVFKCYEIDYGPKVNEKVRLDDQFFKKDNVKVRKLQFLCTPAEKFHNK